MMTSRSKRAPLKKHERDLQSEVLSRLDLFGGKWFGVKKNNDDGCPDIIGWYKHQQYAIELKVDNNKPSAIQELTMTQIREHGGEHVTVAVCRSLKEVFDLIRNGERSP